MNLNTYKCCGVPVCKNTSISTPNKLFLHVPQQKTLRDEWLKLARRNPNSIGLTTHLYFCEDHFDMPNDMENYMQYQVMGFVQRVRMKPGCIPTKLKCEQDMKTQISEPTNEYDLHKKQRMMITEQIQCEEIPSHSSVQQQLDKAIQVTPKIINKSIQVHIHKQFRSKANQTKLTTENQMTMTSPLKPHLHSVATSPFTIKHASNNKHNNPSRPSAHLLRKIVEKTEQSDSDSSYTPSVTHIDSSPSISTKSLQMKSISECSEMIEEAKRREDLIALECTLRKIEKKPRSYIGIPLSSYYLVNLIQAETNIPFNHILLCLKKIRLNNSFCELADDFGMDKSYPAKIFSKNIPIIASVMRPFIVSLDKEMIKKNLPMAFRHKYHKVTCIIDCLEVEIQKPSKALNQALSWSEYKKANTIKYLISCTPNGLVNYVSNGYGGRITDTCIVETSDFSKCLQPGMCVMADRGFKHVEQYLRQQGVQLVRPPSVTTGTKLSKNETRETKKIASLRIHVERVIRRLREFNMLKPHACVNHNLIKVLDDVITIACALINLQGSLIK